MRFYSMLMLSSLLLLGAGCFKSSPISVLPETPDRQSEILVGDLEIEAVTIERNFVLNDSAECRVNLSYPNLLAGSLPAEVGAEADRAMAGFIAKALGSAADVESTSELDALIDDYLKVCEHGITAEYDALTEADEVLFTNLKHRLDIVYSITLNEHNLLSLGLDEYSYTGGAHANQNQLYLNLDLNGNRLLKLQDLIKPDSLKTFVQLEKFKLLEAQADNLYPDRIAEYEALMIDTRLLSAEQQIESYGDIDNFYLSATAIVTYYNPYDLAPYAVGPIFVEIPYTVILDYLDPNSQISPLVEALKQL